MTNKLKILIVLVCSTLLSNAQNKKGGFSFELNNYFVSESKAFNLKNESNPVAFLKNTLAPTVTYDYFFVDKQKFALSVGISQAFYFNSLNNSKLDEFAKSQTDGQPYTLDWQGSSPKINYGTLIGAKIWFPAGKLAALCIEPRGGIRYGGSSGLNVNAIINTVPTTVYEYSTKTSLAVWEMKATYFKGLNKLGLGFSAGYGTNGISLGVAIRKLPPPWIIKCCKDSK